MPRVLVVGGAGFIGSNLVMRLVRDGEPVTVLDNLSTGNRSNLDEIQEFGNWDFVEGDLLEFNIASLGEFDHIYHFASPASPPKYMALPAETMMVNSVGTKKLLDEALATGARVLFASTSEVYGDPQVTPQEEKYWGNVNPIGVRSVYDESKRFGEALVSLYQRQFKTDAIIVRIFNTYGPRMDPYDGRVVSTFIRQALQGRQLTVFGTGLQTRSFCYISDLIEVLIRAMNSSDRGPVNIGNPAEISLIKLATEVGKALSLALDVKHLPLPDDDPTNRKPDIDLARKLFQWEPKVGLQEGIKLTADWMSSNLST